MDEATRERKLDKIRKCLRLSKSAEPHEAAAAIRHAQALMRELGIEDEAEVGMEETTGEVIITKEAFGGCKYLNALASLVCRTFGVEGLYEAGNGISRVRANVRYIGPRSRVMMAIYAHRVIDRAVFNAWKQVRDAFGQAPGARQTFRLNFLGVIYDKVERLAPNEVETAAIARYKAKNFGTDLEPVKLKKDNRHDPLAAYLGQKLGEQFDIHRPMDEDKKRLGHG
jgi:hypothetical protein